MSGPGPSHARRTPSLSVLALSGVMLVAGMTHFLAPRSFDSVMPRLLPEVTHRPLTYLSGAAEIGVGALMLIPRTRRIGGTLTAWLLIAVLPANIDVALRGGYPGLDGFIGSAAAAWIRIPLQIPLIVWARSISRRAGDSSDVTDKEDA